MTLRVNKYISSNRGLIKPGLIIILLCINFPVLFSQQLPIYSQYMMNYFLVNPAIAGSEGYTSFNLTAREQWLGLENAPRTQALSGQTRLLKNSYISRSASIKKRRRMASRSGKVGVGGYMFNDISGIIRRTGAHLTYAYHLQTRRGQLSFGLSGSGFQFKINESKLILYDETDELIFTSKKSLFVPDANVGVYYIDQKIQLGLSVFQLFQSALKMGDRNTSDFRLLRHYYFIGGYRFSPKRDWIVEPSTLIKTTEQFTMQVDLNVRAFYQQSYWGGLSYRTGREGSYGAIVILGGVKVNNFLFGYAFDYTLSSIMKHSIGSHEIMMAIKIGDNARRYRWLNRY